MKIIAPVLVDRANFARMRPVLLALKKSKDLRMHNICAGTMLLERFGSTFRDLEKDGLEIGSEIYLEVEGSNTLTMTKSIGLAVNEFASEFYRIKPHFVVIIGDRYEALAATIAASYLNLCVVHIQGGEVSGSIDESARHAISKFSHYHFPATHRSADFLVRMGERPETVFMYGCPSGDQIIGKNLQITHHEINSTGVGLELDIARPYLVVMFHPVTTNYGSELSQVEELFHAVSAQNIQTCWLWPNIDAGSDHISKFIRSQREGGRCDHWARFVKHYEASVFLKVMAGASCLVGNSSSFIRDGSFLGTPVVLVGDRQDGREVAAHVIKCAPKNKLITSAIETQLKHGVYPTSALYGNGNAGPLIAEKLKELRPYTQKKLAFVL